MANDSGCDLKYEDLGRRYMENAKARTQRNPWDSYLYGLALTMSMDSTSHEEVIGTLKREVPTAAAARKRCQARSMLEEDIKEAGNKTYGGPSNVAESLCQNARLDPTFDSGPRIGQRLRQRPWQDSDGIEGTEAILKQCAKKSPNIPAIREKLGNNFTFKYSKGRDMLMLEAGCDTPVMDTWMLRHAQRVPKELWDDPTTNEWIQSIKGKSKAARALYAQNRQAIEDEARACGFPAGVYHVAKWFEMVEQREGRGKDPIEPTQYLNRLIKAVEG